VTNSKKILLVEGESDKNFFEEICKKLNLDTTVQVAPPKDLGGNYNTKGGVLNHLEILLPQLDDGQITNLAAIVDADYIEHGGGNQKTVERVSEILNPLGFSINANIPAQEGLYFEHPDGLPDFGLWVMPDNNLDGMLEDWIGKCIKNEEKDLFEHAISAVTSLDAPKFKPHLQTKAEIATWLAWQKTPGRGLSSTIKDSLLDEDHNNFQQLCLWLKHIFEGEEGNT